MAKANKNARTKALLDFMSNPHPRKWWHRDRIKNCKIPAVSYHDVKEANKKKISLRRQDTHDINFYKYCVDKIHDKKRKPKYLKKEEQIEKGFRQPRNLPFTGGE